MVLVTPYLIGFAVLLLVAIGIGILYAYSIRDSRGPQVSPFEQRLVMQARKRRTMRQIRRIVRDHKKGRRRG